MKRNTLKHWFEVCLVGSLVAGGCNHQDNQVVKNEGSLLPPVTALARKDPKPAAPKPTDNAILPTAYHAPETPVQNKTPAAELPPVVWADSPAPASAPKLAMPEPLPAATMAAANPVNSKVSAKPFLAEESAMGASRYGHAPDYSWVCGEVMHTRKGWRLRYAGVDETDTYGGSVTLCDDSRLEDLKEGEVFLVKGRLQSPETHSSAPVYVVSDVKSPGH